MQSPPTSSQKLFDGGGLSLLITAASGKRWVLKYRILLNEAPPLAGQAHLLSICRHDRDQGSTLPPGGGWAFDPAAVMAYLAGPSPSAGAPNLSTATGVVAEYSSDPVASGDPVMHAGEQNARQRRDAVNAEILEEKLQRDRGELVVAEDMRKVVTILQASINEGLDRLCRQIVTRLAIPEAEAIMHELVNELRDEMAAELRPLFEQRRSR